VAVGDLNGDGKPDLAVTSFIDNTLSALLNDVMPIVDSDSPATGTISSALEAPASITVADGDNQSATVTTGFVTNLAVEVRDAGGTLVQGVSVTFTAPDSGPSGTFDGSMSVTVVTDASGRATAPLFVANTIAGSYTVIAQASGGSNPSTSFSLTNTAAAADHIVVTVPATVTAGVPFHPTLTVQDLYNNTATDYTGTVHAVTNLGEMGTYTFTAADQGQHTFTVRLTVAGSRTATVTDTAEPSITGSASFEVLPGPVDHLSLVAPPSVPAGQPFDVTVIAQDAFDNTVPGYTGTVTFTTSDQGPGVMLPPDYPFQPSDAGMHTFAGGVTLVTPGDQTLMASDPANGVSGSATVIVTGGPSGNDAALAVLPAGWPWEMVLGTGGAPSPGAPAVAEGQDPRPSSIPAPRNEGGTVGREARAQAAAGTPDRFDAAPWEGTAGLLTDPLAQELGVSWTSWIERAKPSA
jgi:hypothetical protein